MDFAKQQLAKYGWKEGDGLGKCGNGITEAIRPKRKLNKEGVGFCPGEEYKNNWWERAFNKAASNITVENSGDDAIKFKSVSNEPTEITIKKKRKEKAEEYYGSFHKESVLMDGKEFSNRSPEDNQDEDGVDAEERIGDEELFKACGGRTAHKGARHGLKLSGKLARLERQDTEFKIKDPKEKKRKSKKSTEVGAYAETEKNLETKRVRKRKAKLKNIS